MITVVIVVGIVLVLALGFYLTRGAGGLSPLGARGRVLDEGAQKYDPLDADNEADSED